MHRELERTVEAFIDDARDIHTKASTRQIEDALESALRAGQVIDAIEQEMADLLTG